MCQTSIHFEGNVSSEQIDIQLDVEGTGYPGEPANRDMVFELPRMTTQPEWVRVDGELVALAGDSASYAAADTGAWYNGSRDFLYVQFDWDASPSLVQIGFGDDTTSVDPVHGMGFYLQHPFPNPFVEQTTLSFNVLTAGDYRLEVLNTSGQRVRNLSSGRMQPGAYTAQWDGCNDAGTRLSAGLYFVQLFGPDGVQRQRVMLH